jgi:putative oxidoreductase
MDSGLVDRKRLIFPALGRLYAKLAPYSYAFMRFCTGAVLVPHGVQKMMTGWAMERGAASIAAQGLPMPMLLAWLTVFAESFVAVCLALGLFTRLAALIIWIEMAVIITQFQWKYGYFWTNRGIEYALLWLLLCTAIFFRGGGKYSLDHLLGKEF